jgi:hypothetical protein
MKGEPPRVLPFMEKRRIPSTSLPPLNNLSISTSAAGIARVILCYLCHTTIFKHIGLPPVSYKLGLALAYIATSADCRSIEILVDVRLSDVILCRLNGFQKSIFEAHPIGAWSNRYRLFCSGICFLQKLPDSVNNLLSIRQRF